MKKVVITGLGLISPMGVDLNTSWGALVNGRSGVGPITLFDPKDCRTKIAAQVDNKTFEALYAKKDQEAIFKTDE